MHKGMSALCHKRTSGLPIRSKNRAATTLGVVATVVGDQETMKSGRLERFKNGGVN